MGVGLSGLGIGDLYGSAVSVRIPAPDRDYTRPICADGDVVWFKHLSNQYASSAHARVHYG